jgi:hypothetical protein
MLENRRKYGKNFRPEANGIKNYIEKCAFVVWKRRKSVKNAADDFWLELPMPEFGNPQYQKICIRH